MSEFFHENVQLVQVIIYTVITGGAISWIYFCEKKPKDSKNKKGPP